MIHKFMFFSRKRLPCVKSYPCESLALEEIYALSVLSSFYFCIRPERLLCDAERDMLAIAKFLVIMT